MPSARELLEQADALMRRNRARAVDTEIPELTEVVAEVAPAPDATPLALEDVPELVDLVEEIEIASIAEMPDDNDDVSGWLAHDPGALGDGGRQPDSASMPPAARSTPSTAESTPPAPPEPPEPPEPVIVAATRPAAQAPIADDWARWEALAEEIRMQVLQRIDIFTDTRLRKQLSAQLQPIVDRASVQMVETINEEVGRLLRAYIAEAIEREIDKWRGTGG
jgi:hypothetical protein